MSFTLKILQICDHHRIHVNPTVRVSDKNSSPKVHSCGFAAAFGGSPILRHLHKFRIVIRMPSHVPWVSPNDIFGGWTRNDKLPELLTSFTSTLQLFISMCKVAGFSGTLAFLPKGTHPGFVPCTSRSRSRSSCKRFNKTLRWHPKENCQDGKPVQALPLEGRSFTHWHGSFTHWHGPFTHHGSFAHRHRTFAHRHRHRTFAHALVSFWWKEASVSATFPGQICEDASELVNLCFAASLYIYIYICGNQEIHGVELPFSSVQKSIS